VLGRDRYLPVLMRVEGLWVMAVGLVGIVALSLPRPAIEGLHAQAVLVLLSLVVVLGGWFALRAEHLSELVANGMVAVAVMGIPLIVYLCGPRLEVSLAAMVAAGISNFVFQRRRIAIFSSVGLAAGYAVVLAVQDGYAAPVARWLIVVGCMVASSVSIGWLVAIVEELATQERKGRLELDAAHSSVAALNASLEERVQSQVSEIESLNRLRRFLSPQVAEAIVRDGTGRMLEPHRERIAAVFCDLRGFTSFASEVAPEEVIEVLRTWFDTVGELFQRYDATVGTVAGDGVVAYFGDPVPHDDPAGAAVAMAVELRTPMERHRASWDRRGFSLGYGVGIAYGYATMGTIGFDRRHEYTPLGPVVNLASRLCGAAADGEILIDDRAHVAVADRVDAEERLVDLRGFRMPIAAHNIVDWLPAAQLVDQTNGQG
jgi:class 3 adenylate cyclase